MCQHVPRGNLPGAGVCRRVIGDVRLQWSIEIEFPLFSQLQRGICKHRLAE
jgi:hypothetical protein